MTWIYILAGLYIVSAVAFYFGQHMFFFRPEILPAHFVYKYEFPFTEKTFPMSDGGEINAIHFEMPNAKGVVFYLKGNSRSIKGWGKFARDFLGKGYDFMMLDYRGFGKSVGKRTEAVLYSDANYVYEKLADHYGEENIVLYGRSFGSGIAAECARERSPAALILDSPYYSFRYQVGRFLGWLPLAILLKYRIPTYQFLRDVTCPVYIIHGDRDYIISYAQGQRLSAETDAKLVTIEGARHNNLPEFPAYHAELNKVLKAIPVRSEQSRAS